MATYCYLLQSLSDPSKTYIGISENVQRRLAQHNGVLAHGARRTIRHRPWRIVIIVGPFTRSAALAFEYSWAHYGNLQNVRPQRRHLRLQLEVLSHVLQATQFMYLDITLRFADAEVRASFGTTSYGHLYDLNLGIG